MSNGQNGLHEARKRFERLIGLYESGDPNPDLEEQLIVLVQNVRDYPTRVGQAGRLLHALIDKGHMEQAILIWRFASRDVREREYARLVALKKFGEADALMQHSSLHLSASVILEQARLAAAHKSALSRGVLQLPREPYVPRRVDPSSQQRVLRLTPFGRDLERVRSFITRCRDLLSAARRLLNPPSSS